MDENGAMTDDFVIGDYDASLLESVVESDGDSWGKKIGRFRVCDESIYLVWTMWILS